ncbi:MAG: SocA family protein [Rhodobacteraceae bacterium]|nr:SocA family protein [Paracoccaceae bacterium]
MVRYKLNHMKVIDAIDLIARELPNVTQYYLGKILFFADREHLLDFGRPITGDKYVAMEHGPVPSAIRDLLRPGTDSPDEVVRELNSKVEVRNENNLQHVTSRNASDLKHLSGSDVEYLKDSINKYGKLTFGQLREISHEDSAYNEAWNKSGNANEIDILLWMNEFSNVDLASSQLAEKATYGV